VSSNVEHSEDQRILRRRRHRRGLAAELIVAILLTVTGHRSLARRFKSPVGEVDIIAVRGRRVAFVEVKRRPTSEDCEAAITGELRKRVRRAAALWLARNPPFQTYDVGFDLVFVVPWRFPTIMHDAL
jgi:putative endonuclease